MAVFIYFESRTTQRGAIFLIIACAHPAPLQRDICVHSRSFAAILKRVSPARKIAFRVLERVHGGGYATDLLRRESGDPRDLALAESIVLGCLRYQAQLDYLIELFSGRKQLKLDDVVRIALRMGIFQLRYLDRIPAHAAVAESVELVKQAHKRSAAGFVNAVLRKVNRAPVPWPDRATALSMPAWLLDRWDRQFGPDAAAGIAQAFLAEPESFRRGERSMDIGSQSIVPLLDLATGQTFLDLCAAPGNKTLQALESDVRAVACDLHHNRLQAVPCRDRVVLDGTQPLPFRAKFDRVLVDAPCTGTGTLGRNPEIKWRLASADLGDLHQRQVLLLRNALNAVAPGGKLVYSTCSLEPEENEAVIEEVLGAPGVTKVTITRRTPGRDPGDGFFAAVIPSK
jgi:16S rRNA (cytosine967-C5)-methyltransferase